MEAMERPKLNTKHRGLLAAIFLLCCCGVTLRTLKLSSAVSLTTQWSTLKNRGDELFEAPVANTKPRTTATIIKDPLPINDTASTIAPSIFKPLPLNDTTLLPAVQLSNSPSNSSSSASTTTTTTLLLSPPPPRDHPHAGARFANGSWGLVADVTLVRKRVLERIRVQSNETSPTDPIPDHLLRTYLPLQPGEEETHVCGHGPRGREKATGTFDLVRGVRVAQQQQQQQQQDDPSSPSTQRPPIKILCGVYTYARAHPSIKVIADTWGWRCDGFFAASTQTIMDDEDDNNNNNVDNDGYGAIDLPHLGKEEYSNMWQKTRSIWSYMHDNYLNDYDWFYLSGDDTHLIVENLRQYLQLVEEKVFMNRTNHQNQQPLYLGSNIKVARLNFNHGGAGYLLNREALRKLVIRVLPECQPTLKDSAEDRLVGRCLNSIGIKPYDTVDDQGRQVFLPLKPSFIAKMFHGPSHTNTSTYSGIGKYWLNVYNKWADSHGWKAGADLVSPSSVAFHHLKGKDMKRHHAILYSSCPKGTALGNALRKALYNTYETDT